MHFQFYDIEYNKNYRQKGEFLFFLIINNHLIIIKTTNNNMNSEFDPITDTSNFIDFHILLGIFGFVSAVIIWGIIKNR
jgi:hypothetical protein